MIKSAYADAVREGVSSARDDAPSVPAPAQDHRVLRALRNAVVGGGLGATISTLGLPLLAHRYTGRLVGPALADKLEPLTELMSKHVNRRVMPYNAAQGALIGGLTGLLG
jgi:hypothetical protein